MEPVKQQKAVLNEQQWWLGGSTDHLFHMSCTVTDPRLESIKLCVILYTVYCSLV